MTTTTILPTKPAIAPAGVFVDPGPDMARTATAATRLVWPPRSGPVVPPDPAQPRSDTATPRKPLRIWPISDLHLAKGEDWPTGQIPQADVAVVAGDVTEGLVEAVGWLGQHIRPHMRVVCVAGNHEFWGTVHVRALEQGRLAAGIVGVDLLEGDAVIIEGVRFAGATLWTDYQLFGEPYRWACEQQARQEMQDHRRISWRTQPWERFKPEHAAMLHRAAVQDLSRLLREPYPGPTVLVTHHAPHPNSLARDDRARLISAAYASDLTMLIEAWRAELWVHGHTHRAVDYRVAGTRILSNPRGYPSERASTGLDLMMVVEV
jgi:Icc-related predicted phosphoesterase